MADINIFPVGGYLFPDLLLVPLYARKDFEFCRIFLELFVCVIDPGVCMY
jgi:hypothetical protein